MSDNEYKFMNFIEASEWASQFMQADITPSNISYLVQYGRVKKYGNNGKTLVAESELAEYYQERKKREMQWKKELGEDLNWELSFDKIPERESTKHVHRLHPYKGKFIPQLVEYFLDDHTDDFKTESFFDPGDIILDPFCGSGTTLVQANELGLHAIGIDVSEFNALIANTKVDAVDLFKLKKITTKISMGLRGYIAEHKWLEFDTKLSEMLSEFNADYFPSPEYKIRSRNKEFDNKTYECEREKAFLAQYTELENQYEFPILQQTSDNFLDIWYVYPIRQEIEIVRKYIDEITDQKLKNILTIMLSRTIRTCRATTHSDLATLKSPVTKPYYCRKHYKICKPLYSMYKWWDRYAKDTIKRLQEFDVVRTDTWQHCIVGDSRNIDLITKLREQNQRFANLVTMQGIQGIFSSPPYVGMIDYHEQHAYAYDTFDYDRRDEHEIGSQSSGKSAKAKEDYVNGIAEVLLNCEQYMVDDYNVFLVANDDHNLYPTIADKAGMKIVNEYKRPVLNRTERGQSSYSEIIFHIKKRIDNE